VESRCGGELARLSAFRGAHRTSAEFFPLLGIIVALLRTQSIFFAPPGGSAIFIAFRCQSAPGLLRHPRRCESSAG